MLPEPMIATFIIFIASAALTRFRTEEAPSSFSSTCTRAQHAPGTPHVEDTQYRPRPSSPSTLAGGTAAPSFQTFRILPSTLIRCMRPSASSLRLATGVPPSDQSSEKSEKTREKRRKKTF
jgi:hypothetical protein